MLSWLWLEVKNTSSPLLNTEKGIIFAVILLFGHCSRKKFSFIILVLWIIQQGRKVQQTPFSKTGFWPYVFNTWEQSVCEIWTFIVSSIKMEQNKFCSFWFNGRAVGMLCWLFGINLLLCYVFFRITGNVSNWVRRWLVLPCFKKKKSYLHLPKYSFGVSVVVVTERYVFNCFSLL